MSAVVASITRLRLRPLASVLVTAGMAIEANGRCHDRQVLAATARKRGPCCTPDSVSTHGNPSSSRRESVSGDGMPHPLQSPNDAPCEVRCGRFDFDGEAIAAGCQ